jgi:hypothetical protein
MAVLNLKWFRAYLPPCPPAGIKGKVVISAIAPSLRSLYRHLYRIRILNILLQG